MNLDRDTSVVAEGATSEVRLVARASDAATDKATEIDFTRASLEALGVALERLAFRMLDRENDLYISGQQDDANLLAEWRRDVRVAAMVVRKWEIRQRTVEEPEIPADRASPKCQFCPRPAGVRTYRCKWHV